MDFLDKFDDFVSDVNGGLKLCCLSDGSLIVVSEQSGSIEHFNPSNGLRQSYSSLHTIGAITCISVNDRANTVLTGGRTGITVFSLDDLKPRFLFEHHNDSVLSVASYGKLAISGGIDFQLKIWSIEDGSVLQSLLGSNSRLAGNQTWISEVKLLPEFAIAGYQNGHVYIWDTHEWLLKRRLDMGLGNSIRSIIAISERVIRSDKPNASYLAQHNYDFIIAEVHGSVRRTNLNSAEASYNIHINGEKGKRKEEKEENIDTQEVTCMCMIDARDCFSGENKHSPLLLVGTSSGLYCFDAASGRTFMAPGTEKNIISDIKPAMISDMRCKNPAWVCIDGALTLVNFDRIVQYWL
jgi:WD40 repeat protein